MAALPAPKIKILFFTLSFDIDDKNLKTILEIINKVKDVAVIENACSSTGKIDKSSDWESVVKTIAATKTNEETNNGYIFPSEKLLKISL